MAWKPTWTIDQITASLTRTGAEWSTSTLTYGFAATDPGYKPDAGAFSPFTGEQREAARLACELWNDVIAIDLVETGRGDTAEIRFGNTESGSAHAWAYGPGIHEAAGDIWINLDSPSNLDLYSGGYGLTTLLHEIGHALGLSHPSDYHAGAGAPVTYEDSAWYLQDSRQYTVMSYFGARQTGADHTDDAGELCYASTPLLHDIAAIQQIYGADTQTRAGNTVYGFNATAGSDVFDLTQNQHPVFAIWDGGGRDTLDLSGYGSSSTINLAPGQFSSCDGMVQNISIAYGCTIENAVGGSGDDRLSGNTANNALLGGGGGDLLWGGLGADRLTGGAGSDRFDFDSLAEFGEGTARDVITDFAPGLDKIDLSTIDADPDGTSGNQAFNWQGRTGFSGVDGQLRYSANGDGCLVQGDVNGDRIADLELQVLGVSALQSSDFLL